MDRQTWKSKQLFRYVGLSNEVHDAHLYDLAFPKIAQYRSKVVLISLGGSDLKVPGTEERIMATRNVTMAELAKTKRQFINYAKTRAIEDVGKLATMFVQYLNSTLFS